jgi:hypothetical protein
MKIVLTIKMEFDFGKRNFKISLSVNFHKDILSFLQKLLSDTIAHFIFSPSSIEQVIFFNSFISSKLFVCQIYRSFPKHTIRIWDWIRWLQRKNYKTVIWRWKPRRKNNWENWSYPKRWSWDYKVKTKKKKKTW